MKRKLFRAALAAVAVTLLAGGAYAAARWARYPSAPDPAEVSVGEAARYMGTDAFGRLTPGHRKRFALAVAERLRTMPFKDVVGMMTTDPAGRRAAARHLDDLSPEDKEEVGGAFLRSFLDGFYAQSGPDRQGYLMMFALAEKAARVRAATRPTTGPATRPSNRKQFDEANLPSPEQLEKEMSKLLTRQPPRTVAQMSQLFLDMRRTRETFGIRK